MTIEEFNNLSIETKKNLIIHWWHYYGKAIYTLAELEKFIALLESDFDKVLEIAIANFMCGQGPTPLLMAIRKNIVPQMIQSLPNINDLSEKEKEIYYEIKTGFINEVISTSDLDLSSVRK